MKQNEEEIFKKILIKNKLYSVECMSQIRDYLLENKNENSNKVSNILKNAFGVYLIPILFGIIGIYTSFASNADYKVELIKILYIVFAIFAIFTVIIIISITHILKEESITESYTVKRIIKLLTNNIIIIESRRNYIKKRNKISRLS